MTLPSIDDDVRRGFVAVGDRQVHYRRIGNGPPALFIHSSPANSVMLLDEMRAQADRHTCFAFDTPGFGLSDPLSLAAITITDLATAAATAIDALGLPRLPVYGTHTGAAIALELGYRFPEKVSGLVLDAVPIFRPDELSMLLGSSYLAPMTVDALGGHFAATWTRFRDQSLWFPWYSRDARRLNGYDLATPEATHRWLEMFFAAAPHYAAAYGAAIGYGEGAVTAAAGLTVPALFTATTTDMLHPHLARLPPLRRDQRIESCGTGQAQRRAMTRDAFAAFGATDALPDLALEVGSSDRVRRQFVMDGSRAQMIRHAGDRASPVVVVLHDTPGSSLRVVDRIETLAQQHFVVAPDLPGSGESSPLDADAGMAAYAAAMWRLCDAIGLDAVEVEGHGFGASLAVEMAALAPTRCRRVAIEGLLLADADERQRLLAAYAPPIAIEHDGAHWYRLWLRLRDSLVYWPWYDTSLAALRRVPADFGAATLHDWTLDVMKQHDSYHRYIEAALRHDAAARLADCKAPIDRLDDARSPLAAAYGHQLDALLKRPASAQAAA